MKTRYKLVVALVGLISGVALASCVPNHEPASPSQVSEGKKIADVQVTEGGAVVRVDDLERGVTCYVLGYRNGISCVPVIDTEFRP